MCTVILLLFAHHVYMYMYYAKEFDTTTFILTFLDTCNDDNEILYMLLAYIIKETHQLKT